MKLSKFIHTSGQAVASGALVTFAVQMATYVLGFAASIGISRAVGPAGRGEYYVSVTAAVTFVYVLDLSLALVQTYFYAEKKYSLPQLASTTSAIGVVAAPLAVAGMFAFFVLARHSVFGGIASVDFAIAAISVPVQLSLNWMISLFVLSRRAIDSQVTTFAGAVVQAGGVVVLYLLHRLDVHAVMLLFLASAVVPWALLLRSSREFAPMKPVLDRRVMRDVLGLAARLHPGLIFWFLLLRFDTFLVKTFLGTQAVGRYSLAILFAELVSTMTNPLAVAALPFQSELDRVGASALTFKAARFSLAIAFVLSVGAASCLWWVIPVVYGPGFNGVYPAFLALLPGIIAMATARPVQNVLVRQGRPWTLTLLSLLAFTINVALNVVLLRPLGIVGAGLASTVAYVAITGTFIVWASRAGNLSLRHAFWPQAGDVDTVRRLLSRLAPTGPSAGQR